MPGPAEHDQAGSTPPEMTAEERALALDILDAEYRLLMSALAAAWSASLVRTTIFLGVLSATGVALGFAAQGGSTTETSAFALLAILVLPLVLFLGVATFVRLVQIQRESIVYLTGMNRIRAFFQQAAPATRPYFVLPPYDDENAMYRSPGTGMNRRAPRNLLLYLVVQTQGIVGVVTAGVAAALGWFAAGAAGTAIAALVAGAAFVAVVAALFTFWQRSLAELRASIGTLRPTPPDEIDAPF